MREPAILDRGGTGRHSGPSPRPLGEDDPDVLRAVLAVRARSSDLWIRLGLQEERAGQFDRAEQALVEAGRIDHQLAPAWTLANFYLRRGDQDQFWTWARRAAERTYDDYRPLLRLADAFESDPARLLERLGGGAPLTRAYLDFLIAQEGEPRLDDARQAARALDAYQDPADDARLAALAGRTIAHGDARAALEIWNRRFPPLDPLEGRVLPDQSLTREPGGDGFVWRLPDCAGIHGAWRPGEIRFDLLGSSPAGAQPVSGLWGGTHGGPAQSCAIFEHPLPVRPGARYRLHFAYVNSDLASTGLAWSLGRATSPEFPAHDAWGEAEFILAPGVSANPGLATLRLAYRRAAGEPYSAGWIRIRDLSLEPLSAAQP